jgi:hypothetical protein
MGTSDKSKNRLMQFSVFEFTDRAQYPAPCYRHGTAGPGQLHRMGLAQQLTAFTFSNLVTSSHDNNTAEYIPCLSYQRCLFHGRVR